MLQEKIDALIAEKDYQNVLLTYQTFTGDFDKKTIMPKLGYAALRAGNKEQALDFYLQAFEQGCILFSAFIDICQILLADKKFAQVIEFYNKASESQQNHPALLNMAMQAYKHLNDYHKAEQIADKLIAQDATGKYALPYLDILSATKNYQKGNDYIDILLQGEINIPLATTISNFYQAQGQYLKATDVIEKIYIAETADVKLHLHYASLFMKTGQIDKAIPVYAELYKNTPNDCGIACSYATALARNGQFDTALSITKKFQDQQGDSERLIQTIADIYVRLNNWHLARKYFELYREKFPANTAINASLVGALIKLSVFDEADKLMAELLQSDPESKRVHTVKHELDTEKLRHRATLKELEKFFSLPTNNAIDTLTKGDLYAEYADLDTAIATYKNGLQQYPNDIALKSHLVLAYFTRYDTQNAVKFWNEILDTNVFSPFLLHLERIGQSYAEHQAVQECIAKTQTLIKQQFPTITNKTVKKIAIIGGSNSIMLRGWAPAFISTMKRLYDIEVHNYGLGGISSLYGLTILKDKKIFENYDMVIFEYTLNDVYFHSIGGYDEKLIKGMMTELINTAKQHKKQLLCLQMTMSSDLDKALAGQSAVLNIYQNACQQHNIPLFSVTEFLRNYGCSPEYNLAVYNDERHYTSLFAMQIVDNLICGMLKHDFFIDGDHAVIKSADTDYYNLKNIRLTGYENLKIDGDFSVISRETKIIKYNFAKISRSGTLNIPLKKGQILLGLLINSSVNTGFIKVTFGKDIFVKNIYAFRPVFDTEKPRIFLRQFTKILQAKKNMTVRITPFVTDEDLQNLPEDVTAHPAKPNCKNQFFELEIAAVLIA